MYVTLPEPRSSLTTVIKLQRYHADTDTYRIFVDSYVCHASWSQPDVVSEETSSNATISLEKRHDFSQQVTVIGNNKRQQCGCFCLALRSRYI